MVKWVLTIKILARSGSYTLNFEPGEQVMSGLATFTKREGIKAAHISGLEAAAEVEIAYYNTETKEYERTVIIEAVES